MPEGYGDGGDGKYTVSGGDAKMVKGGGGGGGGQGDGGGGEGG